MKSHGDLQIEQGFEDFWQIVRLAAGLEELCENVTQPNHEMTTMLNYKEIHHSQLN